MSLPPNKRLKLTGHRAFQISVLPFGHEIRRFQLPGHLGRQLSREPLGSSMSQAARPLVCLLFVVLAGLLPKAVNASRPCWETLSVEEELKRSDAVFVGTVEALYVVFPLEDLEQDLPPEGTGKHRRWHDYFLGGGALRAVLTPSKIWKGPEATVIVVETTRNVWTDGFPFELGQTYIVYARYSSRDLYRPLVTNACTRTRPYPDQQGDAETLDRLHAR